jgi:hypothetical protein
MKYSNQIVWSCNFDITLKVAQGSDKIYRLAMDKWDSANCET